jgi:hypothetical protein
LKVVREKSQLGWKDVEEHIASLPSISAAVIAEILQKIVANVQEDSLRHFWLSFSNSLPSHSIIHFM